MNHTPPQAAADRLPSQFLGELLRAECRPLAARAATLAVQRGLRGRWGADALQAWTAAFEARIHELASALTAARPDDFTDRIAWARVAYESRAVDPADLAASLEALRQAALDMVPAEDAAALAAVVDRAIAVARAPSAVPPPHLTPGAPHAALAGAYLLALLEGDRLRALALIHDAVQQRRLSVPDAYRAVFVPVLRELGRMWHLAEVNVAEEHFATATTLMAMAQLAPLADRKPSNGRTLLAATVAGNAHEVGVRMVADRFEWDGWRVIYLGPSVPAEDLAQAALDFAAEAVALSASLTVQLDALEEAIGAIRAIAPEVRILVGGAALQGDAALARRLGADALAATPDDALALASAPAP